MVWLVVLHFAVATALLGFLAMIVLLGNMPQIPRRWLEWIREASTDRPSPGPSRPEPAGPVPGRPTPGDGPWGRPTSPGQGG